MQTCIWPSWCHCHSLSLASLKSRLVLPFWYWLTRVVLEKGPLNVCVCVCVCACVRACVHVQTNDYDVSSLTWSIFMLFVAGLILVFALCGFIILTVVSIITRLHCMHTVHRCVRCYKCGVVCVCWSQLWAVLNQLNWSRCHLVCAVGWSQRTVY